MGEKAYRYLAGTTNDGQEPAPEAVGVSRNGLVAALLGVLNVIIIFSPVEDAQKAVLATSLNPAVTVVAGLLWARWDRALKAAGKK